MTLRGGLKVTVKADRNELLKGGRSNMCHGEPRVFRFLFQAKTPQVHFNQNSLLVEMKICRLFTAKATHAPEWHMALLIFHTLKLIQVHFLNVIEYQVNLHGIRWFSNVFVGARSPCGLTDTVRS